MATRLKPKPWIKELILIALAGLGVAFLFEIQGRGWFENEFNEAVRISGPVDEAFLQKTKKALATGRKRLIVTSTGGDAAIGIELAKLVVENEVTVVVRGHCFSACASYIFLPASRRIVEPRSIVGFHHDSFSFSEHLLENEFPLSPSLASDREQLELLFAQRDELRWRELSLAALRKLQPQIIEEAECATTEGDEATNKGPCYSIGAIYHMWIPRPEDFALFDITTDFQTPIASQEFTASKILCGERLATTPMLFGSQTFFGSERCK